MYTNPIVLLDLTLHAMNTGHKSNNTLTQLLTIYFYCDGGNATLLPRLWVCVSCALLLWWLCICVCWVHSTLFLCFFLFLICFLYFTAHFPYIRDEKKKWLKFCFFLSVLHLSLFSFYFYFVSHLSLSLSLLYLHNVIFDNFTPYWQISHFVHI